MLEAVKAYRCQDCKGTGHISCCSKGYTSESGTRHDGIMSSHSCFKCKGIGRVYLTKKEAEQIEEREAAE